MKTIIAGGRDIEDYGIIEKAVTEFCYHHGLISEVISGGARGVDALGEAYAKAHFIPVKRFAADWNRHGKAAGPIRNRLMAEYADALVAIWDGISRGTANMIEQAKTLGLKVYIHRV